MSWPSGSKASNQYTDQDTDLISDARADINQTILNVNSIIDTFDIASPSNGDILQYNSTTSKWEPIDGATLNRSSIATFISRGNYNTGVVGESQYNIIWNNVSDNAVYDEFRDFDDFTTHNSTTGVITVAAGRYNIQVLGITGISSILTVVDSTIYGTYTSTALDVTINPSSSANIRIAQVNNTDYNLDLVLKITRF